MSHHDYSVNSRTCFAALIFFYSILLAGCANTPTWPMENIGIAQFSGNITGSGNILIIPTSSTRTNCQKSPMACQTFATNLTYSINANSAANAYLPQNHETMSIVHDNVEMVQKEIERVSAQYLLIWDVGIIDDRKPFSFGPDAFSISTLKVISIDNDEIAIQLMKPYGLINLNTENFIIVAGETGKRLGGYLSPHLN